VPRARLLDLVGAQADEAAARRRLNTAIWRMRCALEPDGTARGSVVASIGSGLAIAERCETWVDVTEFENVCVSAPPVQEWGSRDAERVRAAVELYDGPFLDGVYSDWVVEQRARLADLRLSALLQLAHWHEQRSQPEVALRFAHLSVMEDPLREDIHRMLIRLYRRAGLPEMAVRQYEACRTLLRTELGVEPRPETLAEARPGEPDGEAPEVSMRSALGEALDDLLQAREDLVVLERRVENAIGAIRAAMVNHSSPGLRARPGRPADRRHPQRTSPF
jgi:DNA-binding SARP family transcriptional activator